METLNQGAQKLGIDISSHHLKMFEVYYRELTDWNKRINLTAITDYDDVQVKHFLDSLAVVLYLNLTKSTRVIDVGTGGGFPGIPIKIIRPDIELTLLESSAKKTDFLKHLIGVLELDGIDVISARAEEKASDTTFREQYDIATTRAVGSLSTNLELTLPYCKIGGLSVSFKKDSIEEELNSAIVAAPALGGQFDRIHYIAPDITPDDHILVLFSKVSPTPNKYPRKPGMPSKRPL